MWTCPRHFHSPGRAALAGIPKSECSFLVKSEKQAINRRDHGTASRGRAEFTRFLTLAAEPSRPAPSVLLEAGCANARLPAGGKDRPMQGTCFETSVAI